MPVLNIIRSTLSILLWLTSEGSLVDLSLFGSWERKTIRLEFQDGLRSLFAHVMDGILISQPVTSLDCVVCVPSPIVVVHIAKSSIDTTLSCNCMWSCGEELGDAGSLESLLYKSESGSESSSSCSHNDSIKGMIDNSVLLEEGILPNVWLTSASLE